MTRLTAAGRKVQCEARTQQTMSQQVSRQRHPSGCHEAGHDGTEKPIGSRNNDSGKPRSETRQQATTHIGQRAANASGHSADLRTTQKQARGPECTRRSAPQTERPSKFAKQRHPTRCHEARPNSRNDALAMERCSASGWNQTTNNASTSPSSHNAGDNASASNAPKAPSSATHPDARERDLPGCQNALANGAASIKLRRFSSATRRKAPAANQPRNNVAGCRHPDATTRKQIKANSPKIRRGITAGITCSPTVSHKPSASETAAHSKIGASPTSHCGRQRQASKQGKPASSLPC